MTIQFHGQASKCSVPRCIDLTSKFELFRSSISEIQFFLLDSLMGEAIDVEIATRNVMGNFIESNLI